ncbi:hypothetical protein [Parablautia muri]|uniref:Uncharacterized protein n=1 Tax=Parablautia muri TaxID=2320879 RepID=A0A9X5GTK8_9FIRM|nr:hypothetical protein [Parablautia muri]NBJ93117.1 hypothetical protein [Parablautia muri]
MAFILFKDKKRPIEVRVKKLSEHQIEIAGCPINISGFAYYHDAEMKHQYGDFSKFTTLYRELDESYILSDDNSVYPEESETVETPEPPLREVIQLLKKDLANMQTVLDKNRDYTVRAANEITDIQIALCEIYEMIGGVE